MRAAVSEKDVQVLERPGLDLSAIDARRSARSSCDSSAMNLKWLALSVVLLPSMSLAADQWSAMPTAQVHQQYEARDEEARAEVAFHPGETEPR